MELTRAFAVAAGSVVGREHARLCRNNQDAVCLSAGPGQLVAVVADGCGQGRRSEVGAALGAWFLAGWLEQHAAQRSAEAIAREAQEALLMRLAALLEPERPERRAAFALDHLLFTWLALVIDPERALVVGCGDGLFGFNGSVHALEAGPQNAPAYATYALLPPGALEPDAPPPLARVHAQLPSGVVRTALIATDGALDIDARGTPGDLEALAADPAISKNPSLLHKRLVVLGERQRRLRDDTTLALVQRRGEEA